MEGLNRAEKLERVSALLQYAKTLKMARLQREIKNETWALELGVPPTSFSQWYRGANLPDENNAVRLGEDQDVKKAGEAAGLTIYQILGIPDPLFRAVMESMGKMPADRREYWADRIHEEAKKYGSN